MDMTQIVYDDRDGSRGYHLWSKGKGNYLDVGFIKFCPVCGRRLTIRNKMAKENKENNDEN